MQPAQALTVLGVPSTIALTDLILGFHFLFALLDTCERLMLILRPYMLPFPQISHIAIYKNTSFKMKSVHASK
jgi:hypothetical protein